MGEPISTALIVGTLLGAGTGAAVSKIKQPNIPDTPQGPQLTSTDTADAMAARRSERQKKQAAAAFGRSDTILTGPEGLGASGVDASGMAGKTLLGM